MLFDKNKTEKEITIKDLSENPVVQPSNTCIKVLLSITRGTITMHIINKKIQNF